MITFISGAPGTGKSAALVSMLRELGKERQIYVFGIPDLKIDHVELADPQNWHNDVPDGSVIVIDEVQNVWRPRGPGQKVPDHIAKLETHRHRGLDFYIISQGPNLVDSNVRALVGRHVHLRDLGVLGRWWYEWPECADNCRTAWKNAPLKKRYRLPKAIFKDYKSSSLHVKPVRSFPWMLVVLVAAVLAFCYFAWKTYATIQSKINPPAAKPAVVASGVAGAGGAGAPAGAPGASQSPVKFIDDRVDWIPRVSSKPESAPAYDAIRSVQVLPRVAGGMCVGQRCKCITQQGTNAGLTDDECRKWLADPPFDPYTAPKADQAPHHPAPTPENASTAPPVPGLTLIDGEARKSSPAGRQRGGPA